MSDQVKMEHINSDLIVESESSLRAVKRDDEAYQGLVASIREKGFIGTISVRPIDGGKYEILDGLHRFNACKDCGITSIPCIIKQMEKSDVLEWQLMANQHKIETRPIEYTQQLQRMITLNPALTMNEIASRLGVSLAFITNRLGLLKLTEDIQKIVDAGKITVSNAQVLCKLPESEQKDFVEFAMTQAPKDFAATVNGRKKQLNEARKQGTVPQAATFEPIGVLRKKEEIETELSKPNAILALINEQGVRDIAGAVRVALEYVLSLDTVTLGEKKALWEQRKAEKDAAAAKRQAEREAKKVAEAREVLKTAGV